MITKTLRTHNSIEKIKLWKYLGGLFYIIIDEENLENRTNQLINDIRSFNNEHNSVLYCNAIQYT